MLERDSASSRTGILFWDFASFSASSKPGSSQDPFTSFRRGMHDVSSFAMYSYLLKLIMDRRCAETLFRLLPHRMLSLCPVWDPCLWLHANGRFAEYERVALDLHHGRHCTYYSETCLHRQIDPQTAFVSNRHCRLHLPCRLPRKGPQSMGLLDRVRVRLHHPTHQQRSRRCSPRGVHTWKVPSTSSGPESLGLWLDLLVSYFISSLSSSTDRSCCSCSTTVTYAIAYFLPIILRDGMGYSIGASQCLVAPPYVLAGMLMYSTAWYGDKHHVRGPIVVVNGLITLIGLPIMGFHKNNAVRYFGVFLVTAGANA